MFVSFEGLDGSGKSTVIKHVERKIKQDYPVTVVKEFSKSYFGSYLRESLIEDKFLRKKKSHKSFFTQMFAILSDWMYLTEYEIVPNVTNGRIVLKDRYIDSLIACQLCTMQEEYDVSQDSLLEWFENIISIVPILPSITFYLDVPDKVRIERIEGRKRDLQEKNGNVVTSNDVEIFKKRKLIFDLLINRNPDRIFVINNNKNIEAVVEQVCCIIYSKLGSK